MPPERSGGGGGGKVGAVLGGVGDLGGAGDVGWNQSFGGTRTSTANELSENLFSNFQLLLSFSVAILGYFHISMP